MVYKVFFYNETQSNESNHLDIDELKINLIYIIT